jgi:hypothetical protein
MTIEKIIFDRSKTHGDFAKVALMSQQLKSVLAQGDNWTKLTDQQREAIEMICPKLARIMFGNNNSSEHWNDISGYAVLAANDYKFNVNDISVEDEIAEFAKKYAPERPANG